MKRISMTLPKKLLKTIDKIIQEKKLPSRSEAIRHALQTYISEEIALKETKGNIVGAIALIYNHHAHNLMEELAETQHKHSNLIDSSLHIHLDRDHCMEIIVIRGEAEQTRKMINKLEGIKNLENIKILLTPTPKTH